MPQIIVETYYEGRDYRLFVVGRRLVAAAQRLPAHVVGDGMHTIAELVERKNVVRRGNPYHGAKSIVLTPAILRNLAEMRLSPSSVPEAGRHVQFHAVANIGSGGESVDVTGQVHPDWAAIAVAAREAVFDPPHAGLDLIAEDISLPPDAQRWAVIEVNTNADFGVNHFPMHGAGRDVAGALLDELFGDHEDHQRAEAEAARTIRIAPEGRVVGSSALVFPADAAADGADADAPAWAAVHARIFGDVQKIGFRQWTWKAAHLRALSGWVRNLPDGSVEAVFGGRPEAVEDMLAQCRTGPDRARVDDVRAEPWRETVSDGFDIR